MHLAAPRGFRRSICIALVLVVSTIAYQATNAQLAPTPARTGVKPGATSESLAGLGLKFSGASTCSNAKCHGATAPAALPAQAGNEYSLWSGGKDPHRKGFESLSNEKGKQIWAEYVKRLPAAAKASVPDAAALKLTDASASAKCISCHALYVPAAPKNLRGQGIDITEGVSCNACHGPEEKWFEVHKTVGWTEKERKAVSHNPDALLAKWGLYDTKNLLRRAEKCTSCHLAIDPLMVEAGHPQPAFELNSYSATYADYYDRHWKDPAGYFGVKLWAAGQAVEVRDAMQQLADRGRAGASAKAMKDAFDQAMAHYAVFSTLLSTGAVKPDASLDQWSRYTKKLTAAGDKAALAKGAQTVADLVARKADEVAAFEPNKASTSKLIGAVAALPDVGTFGDRGMEQQRDTLFGLYGALATSADKPADADAVLKQMTETMYPAEGMTMTPAQFAAALKAVQPKLPK